VLALALTVPHDSHVACRFRLDLHPTIPLTKDQALVAKVVGTLELREDVVGGGVGQRAPTQPRVAIR
jgi:hypothetical protein